MLSINVLFKRWKEVSSQTLNTPQTIPYNALLVAQILYINNVYDRLMADCLCFIKTGAIAERIILAKQVLTGEMCGNRYLEMTK